MRKTKTNSRGFTLIELLVVIAIIGILSSIVLVSLSNARVKARTARSMTSLKAVYTALESYYALNGSYPVSNGYQGYCSCWGANLDVNWIPELTTAGFANGSLPVDPRQDSTGACYDCSGQFIYWSNGVDYKLISHAPESMQVPSNLVDPVRPTWAWGWWTPACALGC